MIAALWLSVASALAVQPASIKFQGCPQVYELKAAGSSPGFNVVFVPAGFRTADDFANYRCAVAVLAKGFATDPVWKSHDCQLGLYRMDLVAPTRGIGVETPCGDASCISPTLDVSPWPNGCPGAQVDRPIEGKAIWPSYYVNSYEADFDIRHCRRNMCRFVWPSPEGQEQLLDTVDRCVPDAKAIVVIANSILRGGGGDASPGSTNLGLAIITVDQIGSPTAWRRLAHELGHVAGLLDEYSGSGQYDATPGDYACGRNVFASTPPDPMNPACLEASWKLQCSTHIDTDCSPDTSAKCQTVFTKRCNPDCTGQGVPQIALYQGAFGQDCDYFRPEDLCLMRDYSAPPCQACEGFIHDAIDSAAGFCPLRISHLYLRGRAVFDEDICPTGPRPPPTPSNAALCGRVELELAEFYGRIITETGVRGEVAVRRAWLEQGPEAASLPVASLEVTPRRASAPRRLQLRLGERACTLSEWTAEIRRRAALSSTPTWNVIDDVTGARWTAEELILGIELPR